MSRDFTITAYRSILEAAKRANYTTATVGEWFDGIHRPDHIIVLRHDVDRRPGNALEMAQTESSLGIRSTYFFRILPSVFDETVVREIADLGHEIGYHYEDFHLARYDPAKAYELFKTHLAKMRTVAPIKSIAMHGSPLARYNNMDLWKHYSFAQEGVKDCILSGDWSMFLFLTDTGRSFDANLTNLRDYIGGQRPLGVRTSLDVANYLQRTRPSQVQLSVHPERWNDQFWPWTRQLALDKGANLAKIVLRTISTRTA